MTSAAEKWALDRMPVLADGAESFRESMRAAWVEAFNAGLERAAQIAESMSENEADGYYGQACFEVAAAIRKEQTE